MSRNLRTGLFIIAAGLLLVFGLFTIGNRTFLFSSTIPIQTRYTRVAGLQPGAPVQYQGVNVGRVEEVRLPDAPGEQILVRMAISPRGARLIHTNTQAQIKSDGLVGEQIVVLVAAPGQAVGEPVAAGGFITGVDPFDVFEITDDARTAVRAFVEAAGAFETIMSDIQQGQGSLGRIIYDPTLYDQFVSATDETRQVMSGLAASAEANARILVDLAGRTTTGIESVLMKIDQGDGTAARLLNDPALYESMLASADTLQAIASNLRAVSSIAENAAMWGAMGTYRFNELMEAAKHNWLFKRYFEERGYMEAAPFEIRERAISETFREIEAERRTLMEWEARLAAMEADLRGAAATPPADSTAAGKAVEPGRGEGNDEGDGSQDGGDGNPG